MSLRSKIVRLTDVNEALQLGSSAGFIMWPAYGAAGHTWPVTVRFQTLRGDDLELLVRPGVFYRLRPLGEFYAARAQLPAGSAPAVYQLDLAEEGASITPGPVAP